MDTDGITAASIIIRLLQDMHRSYSVTPVKQLTQEVIAELGQEHHRYYIFTDLGSYALSWIEKEMADKEAIIILDHHEPEKLSSDHVVFVNPHSTGIDGSQEISGAGVAYLFVRAMNPDDLSYRNLAHLAIVGAIGEGQDRDGLLGLNKHILAEAVAAGTIETQFGLRCFGYSSKPLHRLLEQSRDPYIPGVSGSEEGALVFLEGLGINPKNESGWITLSDLHLNDVKGLIKAIVERRATEKDPNDVFGYTYILSQQPEGSPLRDVREFSTLLNACGRRGKASVGIALCLGDEQAMGEALENKDAYKEELHDAMSWLRQYRYSRFVIEEDGFIIINTEDNVRSSVLGTFLSILARSQRFSAGTYILGIARENYGMTKVSLRIAGSRIPSGMDARKVLRDILQPIGGDHGGHPPAAGGLFSSSKEAYFLEHAKDVLRATAKIMEE